MKHDSRLNFSPVFTVLTLLLAFSTAFAQKNSASKAGKMYEQLGYHEAIQLYREGKLDLQAMERMAHSYRLNGDTWNAERWYAQVVAYSADPLNFLYYAQALHSNGNFDLAKEFYLKYDRAMGRGADQRGKLLAAAIERQRDFQNKTEVQLRLETVVNSDKLDFSPAFFENGVVFVSNREPKGKARRMATMKDHWTGDDFTTLYFAEVDETGRLGEPEIFDETLLTRFHEGPLTFSRSGELLFFTKNNTKKGKGERTLKIYTASHSGQGWSEPQPLDLGNENANDVHPSLSAQGLQLFFSSDRPGGFGGMDLYVSQFSGGRWGVPVNLGPDVNTPGNELFPFIYDDGTLYFASDGWGGLGGLDIYFTEQTGEKKWLEPSNLGTPFNSPKDDFGLILSLSGTEGYFNSSREGGVGKDDIYSFSLPQPLSHLRKNCRRGLTVSIADAQTGEPLPGVRVSVLEEMPDGSYLGYDGGYAVQFTPTGEGGGFAVSKRKRDPFASVDAETETCTTDEAGTFEVDPNPAKKYLIVTKSDGYREDQRLFSLRNFQPEGEIFELRIPLKPANCLSMTGRVLNKRDSSPVPGAPVTLVNLCTGKLEAVKSDTGGNYEIPCVPCGCDFIVQGSKDSFKQDNNLVSTVGTDCVNGNKNIRRDLLLIPVLLAEDSRSQVAHREIEPPIEDLGETKAFDQVFANGITIELENIYYDFDKSDIRPDAATELDKVVALMRRRPDFLVEIRSFTDARGEAGYNQRLSAERANAAREYIVKSGVSPSRITSRGFGETWLTNECEDGMPCSEAGHQMNRRTEIVVFR